jgi:hypothetical protein
MKILILHKLLLLSLLVKLSFNKKQFPKFTQKVEVVSNFKNPNEPAADSNGGDSGEFLRRNQPQEHILIPLINSLEAEYVLIPDIRKYRRTITSTDRGVEYRKKMNKDLNNEVKNLLSSLK